LACVLKSAGFGFGDEVPAGGVDGFGAQEQDVVVDVDLAKPLFDWAR
jgi:hypothetical protein